MMHDILGPERVKKECRCVVELLVFTPEAYTLEHNILDCITFAYVLLCSISYAEPFMLQQFLNIDALLN